MWVVCTIVATTTDVSYDIVYSEYIQFFLRNEIIDLLLIKKLKIESTQMTPESEKILKKNILTFIEE